MEKTPSAINSFNCTEKFWIKTEGLDTDNPDEVDDFILSVIVIYLFY